MNRATSPSASVLDGPSLGDRLLGWLAGAGWTLGLFLALAHLENVAPQTPPADIAELRAISLPLEAPPPPPQPTEIVKPAEAVPAFAGLEIGASDSALHVAVVPPELEALLSSTREPPRAILKPSFARSDFKPRLETTPEMRHVYQVSEVDQPPQAIVREPPSVPKEIFGGARTLRVTLLIVINPDGSVASTRIARSSGQPIFDRAAVETVESLWEFTPAVRRGKKVKCLAQQNVSVTLGGANPFDTR